MTALLISAYSLQYALVQEARDLLDNYAAEAGLAEIDYDCRDWGELRHLLSCLEATHDLKEASRLIDHIRDDVARLTAWHREDISSCTP